MHGAHARLTPCSIIEPANCKCTALESLFRCTSNDRTTNQPQSPSNSLKHPLETPRKSHGQPCLRRGEGRFWSGTHANSRHAFFACDRGKQTVVHICATELHYPVTTSTNLYCGESQEPLDCLQLVAVYNTCAPPRHAYYADNRCPQAAAILGHL